MILEGGSNGVRSALNFVTSQKNKKELLLDILRAQTQLWGWFREQVRTVLVSLADQIKHDLIMLLYEVDGWDRQLVILFVRDIATPEFVNPLLDTLKSNEYWTKLLALDALGHIGGKQVIDALVKALDDPELTWSALAALADLKAKESIRAVVKHLGDYSVVNRLEALRALRAFGDRRVIPVLEKLTTSDPDAKVREKALLTIQAIAAEENIDVTRMVNRLSTAMIRAVNPLDPFLAKARTIGASDVHVMPKATIACRLHGDLINMTEEFLTAEDTSRLLAAMIPENKQGDFKEVKQVDFAYEIPGMGRFRANIFEERNGIAGVFRVIPQAVPDISDLRLPQSVLNVKHLYQGMVIITGRGGSGKTTTMAALTEMINQTRPCHIITMEDPVEYVFERKKALIDQREVGRDTASFPLALREALREDPDVIVVGEMRDLETMRLAIQAAETGHLVLTTLHTPTAAQAISRLIQSFPASEQTQVRLMLMDSLKLVVAQMLIKKKDGGGRIGAFETLVVTPAIATLIREKKEEQIPVVMQSGRSHGMQVMDDALFELALNGLIDEQEAIFRAKNKDRFVKQDGEG